MAQGNGKRTVIFDLDGTLADTSGDLIAAANACFEGLGHGAMLDPVADALTAFHGGRAMLRLGFERLNGAADEADVDREFPNLLTAYEADIDRHTVIYPGTMEAVERLHVAGYAVGICTNKPEGLARLLADTRLGILDRVHLADRRGHAADPQTRSGPLCCCGGAGWRGSILRVVGGRYRDRPRNRACCQRALYFGGVRARGAGRRAVGA